LSKYVWSHGVLQFSLQTVLVVLVI
jgi:hypothetical protein